MGSNRISPLKTRNLLIPIRARNAESAIPASPRHVYGTRESKTPPASSEALQLPAEVITALSGSIGSREIRQNQTSPPMFPSALRLYDLFLRAVAKRVDTICFWAPVRSFAQANLQRLTAKRDCCRVSHLDLRSVKRYLLRTDAASTAKAGGCTSPSPGRNSFAWEGVRTPRSKHLGMRKATEERIGLWR